jgi:hypothetical protein
MINLAPHNDVYFLIIPPSVTDVIVFLHKVCIIVMSHKI